MAAGAASAVLGAAAAVAARGLPDHESRLFSAVHGLPHALAPVLWAPMQAGNALAPVAAAGVAWWRWRRWPPAAGAVLVGLAGWFGAKGVKRLVDRGRPAAELPEGSLRRTAPDSGLGFPSGHATVAFGLVTVLAPYLPPAGRAGAGALATTVGVARIHAGAHLPLDVVGGAALGVLLGATWNVVVGVPTRPSRPVVAGRGHRAETTAR